MTDPRQARRARLRFALYWLPVVLYVGLIFTLSSIHGGDIPGFLPDMDKLEHLLEYSLFGLLAGRAIRFTLGGTRRRMLAALATLGLGAVVGALDEWYQSGIPGRDADVVDWIVDVGAVGIAVLAAQLVHTRPLTKRPAAGPRHTP